MRKSADNEKKPPEQHTKSSGGLYSRIKMSVKTANAIVLVGSVALLAAIIIISSNSGFTLTFESNGGTFVPSQKVMYGDRVDGEVEPTRQGYEFTGWYLEPACQNVWDISNDKITESLTLYAGWEPKEKR